MKSTYIGITIISVIVLAAVAYGFFAIGAPWVARGYKFDSTRVGDFSTISEGVQEFAYNNNRLPSSLAEVASSSEGYYLNDNDKDPETQQPYDYKIVDDTHYQLCAVFYASSKDEEGYDGGYSYYGPYGTSGTHAKGYDCLTYSATINTHVDPLLQPAKPVE